MKRIKLDPEPFPEELLPKKLEENGVFVNRYAEVFFAHPRFSTEEAESGVIAIVSLRELGLENGGVLAEIRRKMTETGLRPCAANAGVFLRFAWKDQTQSSNSVLSGTHEAPDQAVMVFSEPLEADDAFPKGLYLRCVDGRLWLRGYVCDDEYRFPADALFAFEAE